MSKSTPADLAVAFRSMSRRRTEAVDAAKDAPVGELLGELDAQIAGAAALVGVPPDAAAVADAITARPARDWDVATLDALREHAVAAAAVLRRITESGPADEEG